VIHYIGESPTCNRRGEEYVTTTRIGSYYVTDEEIGSGYLCTVVRAYKLVQRLDGSWRQQEFAVKRLKKPSEPDSPLWRSLMDEATIGMAVDHPNLLRVHEVLEAEGSPYLFMDLLQGRPLEVLRTHNGRLAPLDTEVVLEVLYQVALGLHTLHTLTVGGKHVFPVHKDVKPSNIFITSNGTVKLFDYGVCEFTGRRFEGKEGTVYGSALYMSPEQVMDRPLQGSSDQYSMGSLLYELILGRGPYSGSIPLILLAISMPNMKPSSTPVRERCPMAARILERCWRYDPQKRYPSALWLARALWQARRHYQRTNGLPEVRPQLTKWQNEVIAEQPAAPSCP